MNRIGRTMSLGSAAVAMLVAGFSLSAQAPTPPAQGQAGAPGPGQSGNRGAQRNPNEGADFTPRPMVPAKSPEDEARTFYLPPGYRLELVASEPDVISPAVIEF